MIVEQAARIRIWNPLNVSIKQFFLAPSRDAWSWYLDSDPPSLVPVEALLVYQEAHELRNCYSGVGVVHLENSFLRELIEVAVTLLESRKYILHRPVNASPLGFDVRSKLLRF